MEASRARAPPDNLTTNQDNSLTMYRSGSSTAVQETFAERFHDVNPF